MDCSEFKDRIAEMFDSESAGNDMGRHLEECGECRKYYNEFAAALDMVSPKSAPEMPEFKLRQGNPRHKPPFLKLLPYAAMVAVVAVVGIWIYALSAADARATTAAHAFGEAAIGMAEVEGFSARIMVRTFPRENFNYINPEAPFVENDITVSLQNGRRIWRLVKGGENFLVCNGMEQYKWYKSSKPAIILPVQANTMECFSLMIDMPELLNYEKSNAERSIGDSYTMVRSDSTLTLTVNSKKKYDNTPFFGVHDLDFSENQREYVFQTATNRLLSIRYWVIVNGKKRLVLESMGFEYDRAIPAGEITQVPFSEHEWTDLRRDCEIEARRLVALQEESPRDAAERIMEAVSSGDTVSAKEALRGCDSGYLFAMYKGYKSPRSMRVGKVGGYVGCIVTMEVDAPDGKKKTLYMAIRNDNHQRIWQFDGGL